MILEFRLHILLHSLELGGIHIGCLLSSLIICPGHLILVSGRGVTLDLLDDALATQDGVWHT